MSVRLTMIPTDQKRLADLEEVIERGAMTFFEVGAALKEVRDRDLFRGTHKTFEGYCDDRWGLVRQEAYRKIECAGVVKNLQMSKNFDKTPLPCNESQAHQLAALKSDTEQVAAWRRVLEKVDNVSQVTARLVKQVATEVAGKEKTPAIQPVSRQAAAAPTSELFPAEKPRPVQQGPRLQPVATTEAEDEPQATEPEPSDHAGMALDLLKAAEKSIGALQGSITNARRQMNAIGVAAVDVEAIDSRIKEIFDEIKTSKGRLSRGTAATPEAVRDEAGNLVPNKPGLIAAFAERGQAKAMLYALRDLAAKAKAFCQGPGGQHARWQSLEAHIDELRRAIRFSMPYSVCVYCKSDDPACKACHGLGWSTKEAFDQAPREMRNAS